jgi:intracellular septation protein
MQAFSVLAPLVAFFVTYTLRGLYAATAVLMAAMLLLLLADWLWQRHIPRTHLLSTVLVLVLGGATLLFRNRLFIQWKPTVLFWIMSGAFIGSFWIGERTLTERFLAPALDEKLRVNATQWRWLNASSALFYALLGAVNLAVAYYASERAWVYFKLIGLAALTFVFLALQILWVSTRAGALRTEPSA